MQTCLFVHPPPCKFHKQGQCRLGTSCTFLHDTKPTALQSTATDGTPAPKKKSRSRSRGKAKAAAVAYALPARACATVARPVDYFTHRPVINCSNRFSPFQKCVTFPKWLKKVAARQELNPTRESTRKEQPIKADLPLEEEYIRLETVLAQARA